MTDNKAPPIPPTAIDPKTRLLETLRRADVNTDGVVTLAEYNKSAVGQTIAIQATAQPLAIINLLLNPNIPDPKKYRDSHPKTEKAEVLKNSAIDVVSKELASMSAHADKLKELSTKDKVSMDAMLLGEMSDQPLSMTVEAAKQFISDYIDGLGKAIKKIEDMPSEMLTRSINFSNHNHKVSTIIAPPTTQLAKSPSKIAQK